MAFDSLSDQIIRASLKLKREGANDTHFYLDGPAGRGQFFWFTKGDLARWALYSHSDAESGGNAGSTLILSFFNDAGDYISDALQINRATGNALVPEKTWTFRRNSLGSGNTPGVSLTNDAAPSSGAQQYSPSAEFIGNGWNAGTGNATQPVRLRVQLRPVQGSGSTEVPNKATGEFLLLASLDGGAFAEIGFISTSGHLTLNGGVTSKSASKGIGYGTGAGGTVTQATSKATGVTLNKVCGEIMLNSAALAGGAIVGFYLTNSAIGAGDVLVLNHSNAPGTHGAYGLDSDCYDGGAYIYVRNHTAGSLSEAIVIRFALIKGVTA